jgi:beta-lactamase regulating signal transducer with metallopeptidase domain
VNYIYLLATSIFVIWAVVMAIIAIRTTRTNRSLHVEIKKLKRENRDQRLEIEDLTWHLKVKHGDAAPVKKSATNTDYLISEEEYA